MDALVHLNKRLVRLKRELTCCHPEAYEEVSQEIDSVKQEIDSVKRPRKTKKKDAYYDHYI